MITSQPDLRLGHDITTAYGSFLFESFNEIVLPELCRTPMLAHKYQKSHVKGDNVYSRFLSHVNLDVNWKNKYFLIMRSEPYSADELAEKFESTKVYAREQYDYFYWWMRMFLAIDIEEWGNYVRKFPKNPLQWYLDRKNHSNIYTEIYTENQEIFNEIKQRTV